MKIAIIIVRSLMGLLFLFASAMYFLQLVPQPELKGGVKLFMEGVTATGYLMTFIKITELSCSIAFLTGKFVTLATVVIFPVVLNILLFHIFLEPQGLIVAIFLLAANLFLAYSNRAHYKALFTIK
ncbi:MAG: DoxX family protein [Ignavibacteriales bacterium]|nr:DoxX family protein [Ignavibacteriales bacterium]